MKIMFAHFVAVVQGISDATLNICEGNLRCISFYRLFIIKVMFMKIIVELFSITLLGHNINYLGFFNFIVPMYLRNRSTHCNLWFELCKKCSFV